MGKENKTGHEDGDIFIIEADEIIKDDRWRVPEKVKKGLGIGKGDYSIWRKRKGDDGYFLSGMSREKMKELSKELDISLDDQQDEALVKELISALPEGCELKCDHILEVKSQGRMGARKQLEKIFDRLGAKTGDFIPFIFVNNDDYGRGYFVNLLKKSDVASYTKGVKEKYIEGRK